MDKARFDALVQEFRDYHEKNSGPANRAEAIAKDLGPDFEESSVMELRRLIARSETSADAWDALSLVTQRLLRDPDPYRDPLLPVELAAWAADVVEDVPKKRDDKKRARPTKRGVKQKNYTRDENIRTWIEIEIVFQDSPINPTRNMTVKGGGEPRPEPCVEGGSACDVVGVALGMENYATVEKIWTNRWTHLRK